MKKTILLTAIIGFVYIYSSFAQTWIWEAIGTNMDGHVNDMITYDSLLYACGSFTSADGKTINRIAKWSGTNWDTVGKGIVGLTAEIHCMEIYNDELYVGGYFSKSYVHSSHDNYNFIAKWNGIKWDTVGSGLNNLVYAMAVHNGALYVGGDFTMAGGTPAKRIARWDGLKWDSVGTGATFGSVKTIQSYDNELYVGGNLINIGGLSINNIAKWTGLKWDTIGSGVNNIVETMVTYNNKLYVGGSFTTAGGIPVGRIAIWDGIKWDSVGTGFSDAGVNDLISFQNDLYAAGTFTMAGDSLTKRVARWDGSVWNPISSGMDNQVTTLTNYEDHIYAGGWFAQAGGILTNKVARMRIFEPFVASLEYKDISCKGFCDGHIKMIAGGGTTPYTYAWYDDIGQLVSSSDSLGGLCPDFYKVVVKDAGLDSIVDSISLTEPTAALQASTSKISDDLGACEGEALVIPSGGTQPYIFQWNDPSLQTTYTATNLCAATYTVTVTDINNCTTQANIIIKYSGTGITENIKEHMISVYPNPVKNISNIIVQNNNKMFLQLELISIHGNIISAFSGTENKIEIPLHKVSKGMYILSVKDENGLLLQEERLTIW